MKLEYDLDTYFEKIKNNNSYFHTFINKDSLAAGVLVLKPGEEDIQTPHDSDEQLILKTLQYIMIHAK